MQRVQLEYNLVKVDENLNDCLLINSERGGCHFIVRTPLSFDVIRQNLVNVENINSELLLMPSEVTWGPGETYSFYIRHRRTLKDYLSNNDFTLGDFATLINKMEELLNFTQENKINIKNISFDYNSIFIGIQLKQVSFIYIPGIEDVIKFSNCYELISLLILHINYVLDSQEEEIIKKLLEILDVDRDKESFENFPIYELVECVKPYFTKSKLKIKLKNIWTPFIFFQIFAAILLISIFCNIKLNVSSVFLCIISFCLIVLGSLFLMPKRISITEAVTVDTKTNLAVKDTNELKKGIATIVGVNKFKDIIFDINKSIVCFGRDNIWADFYIRNLHVTRRHAELHEVEGQHFLKDLASLNGSFVNGKKIDSNSLQLLKAGDLVAFGDSKNNIFKYKNNLFKNV